MHALGLLVSRGIQCMRGRAGQQENQYSKGPSDARQRVGHGNVLLRMGTRSRTWRRSSVTVRSIIQGTPVLAVRQRGMPRARERSLKGGMRKARAYARNSLNQAKKFRNAKSGVFRERSGG
ncbi:hypothetical protein [Stenotrophomonas sp. 24(2023)]|uniref:hypothetical protein n=1 Tax=Stenotrophomonas sp. 24(2023) TaxID=3068324 RepID=UPI0027DFE26C|nr:hypothetical protein [Stenotrophomonas sp. 24(2023)]WMJ71559.1 hypothetical protein Q9R17_09850 [Stenotrophomonas sp. 24(2023)]